MASSFVHACLSGIIDYVKRVIQHVIDTEADALLRSLLPKEWIVRPLPSDYGVDYEIELVDQGLVTGNRVWIQLKGVRRKLPVVDPEGARPLPEYKEILRDKAYCSFSVTREFVDYALQCPFPLLLVVIDVSNEILLWVPIRNEIEHNVAARNKNWRSQKNVTLRLPLGWENLLAAPVEDEQLEGLRWYAREPACMDAFARMHYMFYRYTQLACLKQSIDEGGVSDVELLVHSLNEAETCLSGALRFDVIFGDNGPPLCGLNRTNPDRSICISDQLRRGLEKVLRARHLVDLGVPEIDELSFLLNEINHAIHLLPVAIATYQAWDWRNIVRGPRSEMIPLWTQQSLLRAVQPLHRRADV